ncbi:hypothetical protein LTR53_007868 [Teratosphaeriaceae sp. CCFEE 6253]|nr:hypothetical protein LTR53_007868 [Teratosphaeriaceae sp. CCFEE 6253]
MSQASTYGWTGTRPAIMESARDNGTSYQYAIGLDPSRDRREKSIRLLRPEVHADGHIVCSLAVFPLRDLPPYVALSYSWNAGPPGGASITLTEEIEVDDSHQRFHESMRMRKATIRGAMIISQDLSDAIRRVRNHSDLTWIWIDAVCIDQANAAEKGDQVSRMRDVYQRADRVYVWLGEETQNFGDSAFTPNDLCPMSRAKLRDLYILRDKAWWSRLWVIQEIALAKRIMVCIGGHTVNWDHFVQRMLGDSGEYPLLAVQQDIITAEPERAPAHREAQSRIRYLDSVRHSVGRREELPLRQLLALSAEAYATEPLDKVNGILGLASRQAQSHVGAAYDIPPAALFATACLHIVNETQSLDILVDQWPRSYGKMYDFDAASFPSWVPNFAGRSRTFGRTPSLLGRKNMCASGTTRPRLQRSVHSITIEALRLDQVSAVQKTDRDSGSLLGNDLATFECLSSVVLPFVTAEPQRGESPMARKRERRRIWMVLAGHSRHSKTGDLPPDYGAEDEAVLGMMEESLRQHLGKPVLQLPRLDFGDCFDQAVYLLSVMAKTLDGRALFRTIEGYIGVATSEVREGDIVTVPFGASLPFLLRPIPDRLEGYETYALVDGCLVSGVVRGELMEAFEAGEIRSESFTIM